MMNAARVVRDIAPDMAIDRWGHAMSAWFDVAAELSWRGETIPAGWDYRPGASDDPRDRDSYGANVAETMDSADLVAAGNLLERYTARLRLAGLDY